MGKTSDELREWVRRARADEHMDLRELDAIADRIDAEMVELPRDRDGVPIRVGDTVYTPSGRMAHVTANRFHVMCLLHGSTSIPCIPSDLTHTRPDSWERIADELEAWCDGADVDGDACDTPRDLAERIRKLAKEGE